MFIMIKDTKLLEDKELNLGKKLKKLVYGRVK